MDPTGTTHLSLTMLFGLNLLFDRKSLYRVVITVRISAGLGVILCVSIPSIAYSIQSSRFRHHHSISSSSPDVFVCVCEMGKGVGDKKARSKELEGHNSWLHCLLKACTGTCPVFPKDGGIMTQMFTRRCRTRGRARFCLT